MTMSYHPWRRLRARPDITVSWPVLRPPTMALTDGHSRIEIDRRLTQAARRCAVDHEMAHIELGHVDGCTGREERAARKLSARRMIPLPALTTALAFTVDLDYAAWDLWVIRGVLEDRLEHLTDIERTAVMDATAHHREYA